MIKYAWAHGKFAVDGNKVWYVPYFYNLLCEYDLAERKLSDVKALPGAGSAQGNEDMYLNTVKKGQNIICIPSGGIDLCVYNMEQQTMQTYTLSKESTASKYFHCVNIDDVSYVFPFSEKNVWEISCENDGLISIKEKNIGINMFSSCTKLSNRIFLVRQDSYIYEYDFEGDFIKYGNETELEFVDMHPLNDGSIAIIDKCGKIYKFNISNNLVECVIEEGVPCHSIAVVDSKLYAFPEKDGSYYIIYDMNTKEKVERKFEKKVENVEWKAHAFSKAMVYDKKIYVMNIQLNSLVEIDTVKDTVEMYYGGWKGLKEEEKIPLRNKMENGCIREDMFMGVDLSCFLKALLDGKV